METKHTPTPWVVDGQEIVTSEAIDTRARTALPALIASAYPMERTVSAAEADRNAEHIVRCVNAHDALVSALREIVACARPSMDIDVADAIESARAALALAEGK